MEKVGRLESDEGGDGISTPGCVPSVAFLSRALSGENWTEKSKEGAITSDSRYRA